MCNSRKTRNEDDHPRSPREVDMLIVEVRAGPRELCIEVGHMLGDRLMSSGRLLVKRRNLICIFHVGGTKSNLKRHDVDVGEIWGTETRAGWGYKETGCAPGPNTAQRGRRVWDRQRVNHGRVRSNHLKLTLVVW
jgi:hypothetical protein